MDIVHRSCLFFSGSMEPAFFRGDLLLLTNDREEPIRAGDIIVFRIDGRDIPIVHRVLKVHERFVDSHAFSSTGRGALATFHFASTRDDGYVKFLTKGDNNNVDDRGLYSPGQLWLERKDVIGRAKGYVSRSLDPLDSMLAYGLSFLPYIGMVTIVMNDYPQLKYLVLAVLGFFVLVHREN